MIGKGYRVEINNVWFYGVFIMGSNRAGKSEKHDIKQKYKLKYNTM